MPSILTAAASKKGFELFASMLLHAVSGPLKKKVTAFRGDAAIANAYKHIRQYRMVKTIWQLDKPVDLTKFYCACRAKYDKHTFPLTNLSDFPITEPTVLEGTVGMGKSMAMRYLASSEITRGERLPIFIELRRIGDNETIYDHLLEELRCFQLRLDRTECEQMLDMGKIALFLDGFDEIASGTILQSVINNIESIARQFPRTRLVVSARPSSEIQKSSFFAVAKIQELDHEGVSTIVHRILEDETIAQQVMSTVKSSRLSERVLATPLMVALLLVRFKINQSIPTNEVAFYDGLFDLLLSRHDQTKPGYKRNRKSTLTDQELGRVFDASSYLLCKAPLPRMNESSLIYNIEASLKHVGVIDSADAILHDFTKVACMIMQDGPEYKFIHKSVMEFHAAKHIAEQKDELIVSTFYGSIKADKFVFWRAQLAFLERIDAYRFAKYLMIPEALRYIDLIDQTLEFCKGHGPRPADFGAILANALNVQSFMFIARAKTTERIDNVGINFVSLDDLPTLEQTFGDDVKVMIGGWRSSPTSWIHDRYDRTGLRIYADGNYNNFLGFLRSFVSSSQHIHSSSLKAIQAPSELVLPLLPIADLRASLESKRFVVERDLASAKQLIDRTAASIDLYRL